MDDIKEQLNRIERSARRTELAVFGDESLGLPGLVQDNATAKRERQANSLKAAGIGGLEGAKIDLRRALLGKG